MQVINGVNESESLTKMGRYYSPSEEKILKTIVSFADNPINGSRRLAFMAQDANIVSVNPSTTKKYFNTSWADE